MPDAKLYVNETYIGQGNGTETFRKKGVYTITARKAGCRDTSIVPQKSLDPTTLLGILIDWGIITILIVDGAITGAWMKYDKTGYLIDPDCGEAPTPGVQPAPPVQKPVSPSNHPQIMVGILMEGLLTRNKHFPK